MNTWESLLHDISQVFWPVAIIFLLVVFLGVVTEAKRRQDKRRNGGGRV